MISKIRKEYSDRMMLTYKHACNILNSNELERKVDSGEKLTKGRENEKEDWRKRW